MKSREISRSKIGPFSLACTDPYIGIGWEYQSTLTDQQVYAELLDGHNVVLTGQAGTGKLFLLQDVVAMLEFRETPYALLCTTGIACLQYFDATTVHR